MRRTHGAEFDIVPRHFVLPRDADEWKAEYERHPSNVYIMKPCSSSRGRGIRVLRKPSDVPREKDGTLKECLVQRCASPRTTRNTPNPPPHDWIGWPDRGGSARAPSRPRLGAVRDV